MLNDTLTPTSVAPNCNICILPKLYVTYVNLLQHIPVLLLLCCSPFLPTRILIRLLFADVTFCLSLRTNTKMSRQLAPSPNGATSRKNSL